MLKEFFVVLGIIFWFIGFFRARIRYPEGPPFIRSFIHPPFWVYFLCGLPRASNLPKGVISTGAVMIQFWGILLVAYGIVSNRLIEQNIFTYPFAMVVLVTGVLLFCWWLYKKYEFHVTDINGFGA